MFNPFKKKPFKIDDFAKLVITEAKKAGIGESLEYDPKRFVLTHGDQRTYLANLFDDYCQADGEHKKRILGNTLALLREKKQEVSFEEAKSKVVAAVREQALFSFATLWWELDGGKTGRKVHLNPFQRGSRVASFWTFLSMCRWFPRKTSRPGASHSISSTKSAWPGFAIARSRNLKNSKAFTSVDGTTITTTLVF